MPSSTSTAPRRRTAADRVDAVVVGAGFGGLSAALTLAEMGARVVVCETLSYAGGCASTFGHRGYRFEAGATLFSGFAEGQLFRRLIDHHGIDVTVDWLDPVVEMRTPGFELAIPPDRSRLLQRFLALAGAPREGLRAFFAHQERVASMLWGLLDEPDLLPPHSLAGWLRQLPRARGFGPLLRDVGRPLSAVAERFGVWDWQPLRTYLDAVCQITVQCPAREAEAPFALGTLDYFFRGTGHVRGGIGQLAQGMVEAIERAGGRVRFTDRVSALEPRRGSVLVRARRGDLQARAVIANTLPQNLRRLLPEGEPSGRRQRQVESRLASGWGACMLYRVARPPGGTGPEARHLELIQDESAPLVKGNHLFCSISGELDDHPSSGVAGRRAPEGHRTMTVSTHLSAAELASTPPGDRAALIDGIHRRMREGLDHLAPEWRDVRFEATASPRTFERFTARHGGLVGGIPRRVGWRSYLDLFSPPPSPPRIHPVGDSVFPGQSTLAVALGGVRLARRLAEGWGFGPGSMGVRPVAGAGSEPAAEWLTAGVGKRFE